MKYTLSAILFIGASSVLAAMLGVLESSEATTTVTGQSAWRCTYNAGGQKVTVILKKICPPTMQFE